MPLPINAKSYTTFNKWHFTNFWVWKCKRFQIYKEKSDTLMYKLVTWDRDRDIFLVMKFKKQKGSNTHALQSQFSYWWSLNCSWEEYNMSYIYKNIICHIYIFKSLKQSFFYFRKRLILFFLIYSCIKKLSKIISKWSYCNFYSMHILSIIFFFYTSREKLIFHILEWQFEIENSGYFTATFFAKALTAASKKQLANVTVDVREVRKLNILMYLTLNTIN